MLNTYKAITEHNLHQNISADINEKTVHVMPATTAVTSSHLL